MPDYPRGDWMSPWQADEKIVSRAQDDWRWGNVANHPAEAAHGGGPELTPDQARARVKTWTRHDSWAQKAVAVVGVNRAAEVYRDAYADAAETATGQKTPAQLDAEIAEVLTKPRRR